MSAIVCSKRLETGTPPQSRNLRRGGDHRSAGLDVLVQNVDGGDKTFRFERQFSKYQGCADSVMVNSGSSADLLLALLLTNPMRPLVEPGNEVIVPVVTWPTQIWSVMMSGVRVKSGRCRPAHTECRFDDLEAAVGERTRVLVLVHLMGNPCHMDRIATIARKHRLLIIEDCCEAMGATWAGRKVGNFGLGSAFSFFFSHHITTMEGGMIAVKDAAAAEQLRILRAHGWVRNVDAAPYNLHEHADIDPRYAFVNWGVNVRPTEVQAAFGLHQLEQAEVFAARRARLSSTFATFLSGRTRYLSMPRVEEQAVPAWLALPLMVHQDAPFSRSEMTSYLERAGVETRPIVAGNLARHPVASRFPEFRTRTFEGANAIHTRGFYIGLSPIQTDAAMDRLVDVFTEFLAKY